MNFEYYIGLSYNERIELVKKPFYEIFYDRSGFIYNGYYFEIPAKLIHEILDSDPNKRMSKIIIIL